MSRKIDANEVALTIQTLDAAPWVGIRDGRRGNFHRVGGPEERVLRLRLFGLVELSVANERVEESRSFDISAYIAFPSDRKAVETATQSQTLKCFFVDRT